MRRKQIAVCDREQEYTLRFAEYANRHRDPLFLVHGFTSLEELTDYTKEHPVDMVLLSENLMGKAQKGEETGQLICLSEQEYQERPEYPAIYKYQSCPQILKKAFSIYAEENQTSLGLALKLEEMKRIGIFSPIGRVGKTGFALALGKEIAKQKRVLYLNMEEYSGFEVLYPQETAWTLSELMYFLKQGKRAFACKLESIVRQIGGLDYIPPVRSPVELHDIRKEDWEQLLETLGKESRYEFVILDFGSVVEGLFELLEGCDGIYMPLSRDETAQAKIRQYEDTLKLLDLEDILEKTVKFFPSEELELENYGKEEGRRWCGQ